MSMYDMSPAIMKYVNVAIGYSSSVSFLRRSFLYHHHKKYLSKLDNINIVHPC